MDNFRNHKVVKLEQENEALLAQVEEMQDGAIKAKDYMVSLSATINELSANISELRNAHEQRLITMTNEEVDAVFSKAPQQSLDSLKARIEEEILCRCANHFQQTADNAPLGAEHRGRGASIYNWNNNAAYEVSILPRKYQLPTNENQSGSR